MNERWYVGRFPDRIELVLGRAARGAPSIAAHEAAFQAEAWFPDDAGGRVALAEILTALGEPRAFGPIASIPLARARVREALRDGRLAARVVEEKLSATPVEKPIEVETKLPEEKHFVEFIFTYPDGSPVAGVEYELVHPDGHAEAGKLGGDGTITKEDVPKGAYVVVMKEVESVRFSRSRARLDDEIKIVAQVSGFPSGAAAKINVYREHVEEPGNEVQKLDATVKDDRVEATFKYDINKTSETKREEGLARFIAEVALDGGKVWGKTQSPLVLELPTIRAARWSTDYAEEGDTLGLSVDVYGFADGTSAKLDVYRFHEAGGGDEQVKSLDAKISGGRATGSCTYGEDDPKGDISREGEYYFEVTIDGDAPRKARSGLLWCTDAV